MSDRYVIYLIDKESSNTLEGKVKKNYVGACSEKRLLTRWGEHMSGSVPTTRHFLGEMKCENFRVLEWNIDEKEHLQKEWAYTVEKAGIHGAKNVRGGPYLTDEDEKPLLKALNHLGDNCHKCNQPGHKAAECTNNRKRTREESHLSLSKPMEGAVAFRDNVEAFGKGPWNDHLKYRGGPDFFFCRYATIIPDNCQSSKVERASEDAATITVTVSLSDQWKRKLQNFKIWQRNVRAAEDNDGKEVPVIFMWEGRPKSREFGELDGLLGYFQCTLRNKDTLECDFTMSGDPNTLQDMHRFLSRMGEEGAKRARR